MRDHTKLRAFQLADQLAVAIYKATRKFPREEVFGLTSQVRRAAVSIASNIVEGCARRTQSDYVRFLDMAFGSARETEYQISLACRLGYIGKADTEPLTALCTETPRVLNGLLCALRRDKPDA